MSPSNIPIPKEIYERDRMRRIVDKYPECFGSQNDDGDYPYLYFRRNYDFRVDAFHSAADMRAKLERLRSYDPNTAPQLTPEALKEDRRRRFDLCTQDLPCSEAVIGVPLTRLYASFVDQLYHPKETSVHARKQLALDTGVFPWVIQGVKEPGTLCGDGAVIGRTIVCLAWRGAESGDAEILAALTLLKSSVTELGIWYRSISTPYGLGVK